MGLFNELSCYGKLMDALVRIKSGDFLSMETGRMQFLDEAAPLLSTEPGLDTLMLLAPHLDESLLFLGRPWENPSALNPSLVHGTLKAGGRSFVFEALSNLRMLSIALGQYKVNNVSPFAAKKFLNEAVAQNIDCLFPTETEEARIKGNENEGKIALLYNYLLKHLSPLGLLDKILQEIEKLTVQRPIMTDKIVTLIHSGIKLCEQMNGMPGEFQVFARAIRTDVPVWGKLPEQKLILACRETGEEMQATGLVSTRHCNLIQFLNRENPDLLPAAFGLSETGEQRFRSCKKEISLLIDTSIRTATRQGIYGLACLMDRPDFQNELVYTLYKMLEIQPCRKIASRIKDTYYCGEEMVQPFILTGMIQLLGLPLGVGQGYNPTCQSTRALSYWSQKNPLFLMDLYIETITKGYLELEFEGKPVSSLYLSPEELNDSIALDPVSVVLIPHLHAIYAEMINRAIGRGEDVHKWINPAFYHLGVLEGFAQREKRPDFDLLFSSHYYPGNNFLEARLPQPAGIIIYDSKGEPLGAHAILIQRIDKDQDGHSRVYFYNPNNDSKQTWGKDMVTSVAGNGEKPGEGSLPFGQFLTCLYAFHYPL
ncbi:hypothetical protein J7E71_07040 [Mesobacillus foraminis]|uniref:hypothetical protein n=1 Tax=Mesobacillus foraminis TaxID=279826 RepID=UPI001BECA1E0|nr:hypothetical protein [Mesobacillus foraminis]MBT2755714.1 hypothetical protein [Mesobacillus foraminis]